MQSVASDPHLGGQDFDIRMVNHFVSEFNSKHWLKDLCKNPRALRRLRNACELAKRTLSSSNQASIKIDTLFDGINFSTNITRTRFEELCADLFPSTMVLVEKALRDAEMYKSQIDEIVLVGGSSRIPMVQKLLSDFFNGKQPNQSINPKAVAYGAAIQAAKLSGDKSKNIPDVFYDVTPISLGIEKAVGLMKKLIKRNTTIPTKESETFTTEYDNQSNILFKVYEGEHFMTEENHLLGKFELNGIPPAPKGLPIEITFDIDVNGILNVSAKDKSTGKQINVTITNDEGRFSKEEMDRMISEAEKFRVENLLERTAAKNALESYCSNIKTACEDKKYKLIWIDKEKMLDKCQETLSWLNANQSAEKEEYENRLKELKLVCNPVEKLIEMDKMKVRLFSMLNNAISSV